MEAATLICAIVLILCSEKDAKSALRCLCLSAEATLYHLDFYAVKNDAKSAFRCLSICRTCFRISAGGGTSFGVLD